jgi:DNA processing protein
MTEKQYLTLLCSFVQFGPARVGLLIKYFGNARSVWDSSKRQLLEVGLKERLVDDFIKYRSSLNSSGYFKKLRNLSISYFVRTDKEYPASLAEIDDAPYVIYVRGELKKADNCAVAIVGSRKMTSYGREVTERFSGELAGFGVTVVSGLARGVDTVAHQAALDAGGRTIAVVGSGLDRIYPPENMKLANEIITKKSAVISEYPLNYPALPTNFPSRNRIISGLSRAVIVVEGAKKSGTLLTATAAGEQGRTVFAVPGQITSPLSEAPLFLIQNGAKIASNTRDILDEIDLEVKVDREVVDRVLPSDELEERIYTYLENEPLHMDELARISKIPVSVISAKLTVMELRGVIKCLGGGVYKKMLNYKKRNDKFII